ncbi:MAG: hypothetical protein ABIR03_04225 [Ginsengibacter sp.]
MSVRILIALFLLRIFASLIGCYFNLYYYPFSDSLTFHNEGIIEYDLLFNNTKEYFTNIFEDTRNKGYSGFLEANQSFWNDTRSNLIIKMLSVFDLGSGKNFFINTLFYNFLVFFGVVALYKVFIKIFPTSVYQLIICVFILPSALFFSAMIHRDGLILLCLSMLIYHLFFLMRNQIFSWKRLAAITTFLLLILLLRGFVFIALVPALLAWIIAQRKPKYTLISFTGVYVVITILFFCSGLFSSKTDLPRYVSERQIEFIKISQEGASTININPLYHNFRSFFNNIPQAINHSLMRPYFTEIKSFVYLPFAMEIFLFGILFLLFIFFRKKNITPDPLLCFCVFFSMTLFLIIGYTIPIIGAIVRYRSIYFIFLMIPIICGIDWSVLTRNFYIKNKKM